MIQDYDIFAELSRHLGLGDATNFKNIQVIKHAKDIIERKLISLLEDFSPQESMHRDLLISYIDIGQKVRCNNKILKNLSKASMVIAKGESKEEKKAEFFNKAIRFDFGNNLARLELANIEFSHGNYNMAFSLFNVVQQYSKAIDCLDKIDDNEMKASFFAEKGRSEKAIKWLKM